MLNGDDRMQPDVLRVEVDDLRVDEGGCNADLRVPT
jgi:hypothetical protein